MVALSGIAPDIDAVAYAAGIVWYGFDKDLAFRNVWEVIHHRYTHGLGFILLTGIVVFLLLRRPAWTGSQLSPTPHQQAYRVAGLAMLVSMLHIFCDLVAGGPTWPIFPWWPISSEPWSVSWSYTLAQWPNTVILVALLIAMMAYPKYSGYSPLESLNYRLDRWFTRIIESGSDELVAAEPEQGRQSMKASSTWTLRAMIYILLLLVCAIVVLPLMGDVGQLNLPVLLD